MISFEFKFSEGETCAYNGFTFFKNVELFECYIVMDMVNFMKKVA